MPEYRSGENNMYYDRAGDGYIPVIFIHGFLASSRMWRDYGYLDALPAGFCAYVPDMRGHGNSNAIKYGCDLKQMARDVAALINDRALVKSIVVGMSMGGGVGLKLALDYPDLLRGLVLISPGFGSPLRGLKRLLYPLLPYAAQKSGLLLKLLKSAFVKLPPEDIVDGLLEDAMKVSRETWRQFMHPDNNLGDLRNLNQVKIPVCFI
jgi:pimeloyl-ACP methyl ester carboxylesterase